MDARFSRLHSDPVFKRPKKDASKLVVDSRFAQVLEPEFDTGAVVDKYGRKHKQQNNLRRFYKLDGKLTKDKQEEWRDLARGEGSDSDESTSESEPELQVEQEEEEEVFKEEDVPLGEESSRLAVVNLDWDHVKAADLYKLLDGFKPKHGYIKRVTIYLSDFGRERLEKEGEFGPPNSIFNAEDDESSDEELVKNDEGEEFNMTELRKYQLERLRYYYAIVEADSVDTARAVYKSCDGAEFESSANFLDLRYVPDETSFDNEVRDEATDAPVVYEPKEFITQALQHSRVKLTWDADDTERTKITRRKFTKDDIEKMDFKAYLASDSEQSLSGQDEETIKKYKDLVADEQESDNDQNEMEITFTPGLTDKAAKRLEEKQNQDGNKNETVFEKYLRERKEKRKAKKLAKKQDGDRDANDLFDSDDMGDAEDPFFQSEFGPGYVNPKVEAKKEEKKLKKQELKLAKQEREKNRAELELLLLDESENKAQHFDMKDVIKDEKAKKGRKSRKAKKEKGDVQDDFEIDLNDSRFSAVIETHQMAIDPTNPQFKRTKAMEKLLAKRRDVSQDVDTNDADTANKSRDLTNLISSIKRKAASKGTSLGKRQKH